MLENLLQLIKENAGEAIINNHAIPNERNDEAIALANSSIVDSIKNAVSNGNLSDVMTMFDTSNNDNPLAGAMQNNFVQGLIQKFGLDANAAGGIANNLLPTVVNKFVSKTADPNDSSFNLQDMITQFSGGNANIGNLINQFTGGNNNEKGGGILDNLKGLFGN